MVSIWWCVFDGWSLMVGIDGGGYFVCVFDGGYWWWWVFVGGGGLMVVVVGTLCGCLTVGICCWWWWCHGGYGCGLFCYGEPTNGYGYKKMSMVKRDNE